jgi:hypothetical protein
MIMIMGHNVRLNRLLRLSVKKESAGLTIWHKWESSYLEVIRASTDHVYQFYRTVFEVTLERGTYCLLLNKIESQSFAKPTFSCSLSIFRST